MISEFTKNELRLINLQHQQGHLLRNLYPDEYEMECYCDDDREEEVDAEDYADERLEIK